MLGVGVALTGGPDSPALPILLLPIVTLPARFNGRGVVAGVAVTVLVLLAAAIGTDPAGYAADPALVNVCVACCVGLAGFAQVLMRAEAEQRADAILDPLTGLLNRKSLRDRFAEIGQQAALAGGSVALVACDLDRFKAVNDEHGHERGDAVLKDAAYVLRKHLRSFELIYRLGGEEFLVVLPGMEAGDAAALAERLRAAVEWGKPGGLKVTISAGVAAASGSEVDIDELFKQADAALYEAKRTGRNRVVAAERAAASSAA
jgi:diguanylate cyclase (GGDEF)-like protein